MKKKVVTFLLFFLLFSIPAFAALRDGSVSATLLQDISNGNKLNLFPLLPKIQLPAGITVHLFMLLLSAALILAVFLYSSKKASLKPRGLHVVVEELILFMQNDIVFSIMGEKRGRKWLPFFCTLFLFITTINLLGLIPAFKTATGNINVTSSLALMIFILIFFIGIKNLGFRGFFKNFYPEGTALPIGLFVAFLEFVGVFLKSAVLSLRLFANMFAGHLAILSFLMLIFVLSPFMGIIAVPFALFTYLLEVIIGLIQALVFTFLSCIFITMASSIHEH